MNIRQGLEIKEEDIGELDLHGTWTKYEVDQTRGFYDVGDNVSRSRTLDVPPTDKQENHMIIEEKLSMISTKKVALEVVFPEDFQAHIDDFDNNDGGGDNDDDGSDNVDKENELAGKSAVNEGKDGVNAEKDGVNAEKDGENAEKEGEVAVNEEQEDIFEEETFTQWIETNSEWVGETQSMIEETIDEKEQWKVFSAKISAQFKHDVSSISLSEVDLAFFPICASGHFYVVVFHIKKQSSMIILDNSDCGETYNSKYKVVCETLKKFFSRHLKNYNHPKHAALAKVKERIPKLKWRLEGIIQIVSLLRRTRFKIATKILLHELNVYAQKMFDLAYKFETENDEQTRISIIVNAIKNRAERDPAKTKTVVENQEEDAGKSK
ncbi:hypothetical protein Tco_0582010 [Tanacetum coccineum]